MSELTEIYAAIDSLWKTVPSPVMPDALRAMELKVSDWIWQKIGAKDHFDLLTDERRQKARRENWSWLAVTTSAGYPGCSRSTLRDTVHYNAHWVDQHLRGTIDASNGRTFNHDLEQARLELELTQLVRSWLANPD